MYVIAVMEKLKPHTAINGGMLNYRRNINGNYFKRN